MENYNDPLAQYLLSVGDTTGSFLSVATSELVADLRRLDGPDADLTELVALLVQRNHHLVNNSCLAPPHEHARVTLGEPFGGTLQLCERENVQWVRFYFIKLQFHK